MFESSFNAYLSTFAGGCEASGTQNANDVENNTGLILGTAGDLATEKDMLDNAATFDDKLLLLLDETILNAIDIF